MGNERVVEEKGGGGEAESSAEEKRPVSEDKEMDSEKCRGKKVKRGRRVFSLGVIHSSPSPSDISLPVIAD